MPLAAARARRARSRSRSRRRAVPNVVDERRRTPTRASSARTSRGSTLPAVRIAFDVSPLSHPRTGVGNYIRGSLAGLVEAAGSEHEVVAVRADEPAGAEADPRGARRHPGRAAAALPPVRALLAPGLEPRRLAAGRAVPRPDRRAPLHRLDVPAAARRRSARRWSTTSCRCGSPSGCRAGRSGCTARSTGTPRAPATWSSSTRSSPTGDVVELLGVAPEKVVVAYPGVDALRRRASAPTSAGRTCSRWRRSSRARTSRRCSAAPLARGPRARGRRRRGLGAAAGARPARRDPARLRRRRRARAALPRRRGVRLPVAVRGLRDPDRRGDGEPASRCVASAHPSMDEAAGDAAVRADPDDPAAIGAALEEALRRRDELVPRGLAHAARFTLGRDRAASCWRRSSDARRRSTPRRSSRRRPARRATSAGCSRTTSTSSCPSAARAGRRRSCATPGGTRTGCRARRAGLDVLHCPTFRGAVASARPGGRDRPRPRRPAPPGDVQPVDAALQPLRRSAGGAGGEAA